MTNMAGHNGGPPLERFTLRTRWAKALFADPETPTYVMAMAWVIHWFSDKDGHGAAVSNDQFEDICNMSRPSVTKGKAWLVTHGYLTIRVGDGRGLKSVFSMRVPETAKGEAELPLSETKGEATKRETTLPLAAKGETSEQKGETSLHKGATTFPPILEDSRDSRERAHTREGGDTQAQATAALHRMAYEMGQSLKGGKVAKSARAQIAGELDGSDGIKLADGKLTVFNGTAATLMADYPGIDLNEVCDRACPEVIKISHPTAEIAKSILRKWARILLQDKAQKSFGKPGSTATDAASRQKYFNTIVGNK